MKQIALDIGLATGPTLANFFAGINDAALKHLTLWVEGNCNSGVYSPVPTYLWGAQGSGKTHLLKAVMEGLRERGAKVGWLDASVQNPPEFNAQWAAVLFDDVHFYSPIQQHAAFNWFINAQTHQCWVLGAGSEPPADLKLREDLRTRLGWGLIFQLHPLGEPERRAVLRQAADARGVFLSDEVMDFMLNRFSRDLGSLMELLQWTDDYALQTKRGITIPLIKSMMENT
jgi:DnaA-homolog protein